MGSGTVAIEFLEEKRKYIGFEIEKSTLLWQEKGFVNLINN